MHERVLWGAEGELLFLKPREGTPRAPHTETGLSAGRGGSLLTPGWMRLGCRNPSAPALLLSEQVQKELLGDLRCVLRSSRGGLCEGRNTAPQCEVSWREGGLSCLWEQAEERQPQGKSPSCYLWPPHRSPRWGHVCGRGLGGSS